jgi:hypothetical protein
MAIVFFEDGQPKSLIFNEYGKMAKKSDYAREGLEFSRNGLACSSTVAGSPNGANGEIGRKVMLPPKHSPRRIDPALALAPNYAMPPSLAAAESGGGDSGCVAVPGCTAGMTVHLSMYQMYFL